MKTKICGLTNIDDALHAISVGTFALGFNFYHGSPRYISLSQGKAIVEQLPSSVETVGILIEPTAEELSEALSFLSLVQVYNPCIPDTVNKSKVILALQAHSEEALPDASVLEQFGYLLLDAPCGPDGLLGGTGKLANWSLAKELAKRYRLILAGGLTPENIFEAVTNVRPYAVDVASGVESSPGYKNKKAVTEFILRSKNEQ